MADRPAIAGASVGVAVPVFNGERFVAATLRSVLAQNYPVADVVVVDDGSDDASARLALDIGPPVRVVRQPARRHRHGPKQRDGPGKR